MHRSLLSAANRPAISLAALMAGVILEHGTTERGVVGALQRAGFTGTEIAQNLDFAVRLAEIAMGKVQQADPRNLALHRALVPMVAELVR